MMLGAVDTIMLSQYSDESVAAVGVVNQIVMFAFLVFEVINIGTSVLCSQYLGAKMQKNMIQVVGVSLLLRNLVVGVLIDLILHFGATTLLGWMGLRPIIAEIWYRLHGNCGCIRFLSGNITHNLCIAAQCQ